LQAAEWFAQGIKPPQVARRLRVSPNSAYAWRRRWRAGGEAALASIRLWLALVAVARAGRCWLGRLRSTSTHYGAGEPVN